MMEFASSVTKGTPALLMNEDKLTSDSSLNSPGHSNTVTDAAAMKESILFSTIKCVATREPLVQITDWDSQTLLHLGDESLKHSRYKIGGSTDSLLSLASSQSLLPLEWKILRSSQSQGTLAHFSGITQENTSEKQKTGSGNEPEAIDDIIGDEVAFKIGTHVLNHNLGVAYTIDSQTVFPTVCNQAASFKEGGDPNQCSQYIPSVLCPQTESTITEAAMQADKTINSVDRQDSSLIDQLWTPEVSAKNSKNTLTLTGLESNNHEPPKTEESPALSERLLKSQAPKRWEPCQPMNKVQAEDQVLPQGKSLAFVNDGRLYRRGKSVLNEEQPTYSPKKFEGSSPINLQQQIVNLKSQVSDLREANESAVLDLLKADEISHMKSETTQLKHEYLQKLADCKEENLTLKINRVHNKPNPVDTYEQILHEEIYELRYESRRLREINHQLNEQNHKLKEQLWDIKRQYEWLMNVYIGKQAEELPECSRNNTSPSSINSESTDTLIARCCDKEIGKENGNIEGDISETNLKISNNFCCIGPPTQSSHENYEEDISNSASRDFSHLNTSNEYSPKQVHLNKASLPRRPFAPRSATDLKVGNLVKFSCPAGKISKGTVKYLGPLFGREEDYVGIELEGDQLGRHDGTFHGTRYFLCAPNKGVFVNFSKVIIAWE